MIGLSHASATYHWCLLMLTTSLASPCALHMSQSQLPLARQGSREQNSELRRQIAAGPAQAEGQTDPRASRLSREGNWPRSSSIASPKAHIQVVLAAFTLQCLMLPLHRALPAGYACIDA